MQNAKFCRNAIQLCILFWTFHFLHISDICTSWQNKVAFGPFCFTNIFNCVQYVHMKILTTTQVRKTIGKMINQVKYYGEVFGIGRRNSIDALLIQFPESYNKDLNDITNINSNSKSFDFLKDEPETYSLSDLKETYV